MPQEVDRPHTTAPKHGRRRCARIIGALVIVLTCGLVTPVNAAVITPAGLHQGDTFRMVFVTSSVTTAISSDISYYDNFVSSVASLAGLGAYKSEPVSWQVIGSTAAISANAPGRNSAAASTSPIYRLDGLRVANSGAALWGSALINPINLTELFQVANIPVWTGSTPGGAVECCDFGLGGAVQVAFGFSGTPLWAGGAGIGPRHAITSVYAISSILTVPEPTAVMIFSVGIGSLAWSRRRRLNRNRLEAHGIV